MRQISATDPDPLVVFLFFERRWMMLIIEIHVDTVENAEPAASTQVKQREDDRLKKGKNNSSSTGNRFWNAIKVSIPCSLVQKRKMEDE